MDFSHSVEYLLSLGNEVSAMKLGLENIRTLLAELGNPHDKYLKVQVAGTNGKGSVCAFLDSICNRAGLRTGTYTSPHLVSITERIRINGIDITEDEFARIANVVRETSEILLSENRLEYRPPFFEQLTAIALVAFADAKVELAILETGLGGRLDATTAVNAEIAAITRIDLDHQEYLGGTIEEIAAEKAAIITAETQDVVLGEQSREVMPLLRQRCSDFGIDPLNDEYEPWQIHKAEDDKVRVILSMLSFPPIRLGLLGKHQIENALTAIQLTRALLLHGIFPSGEEGESFVIEGLQHARHPGRLEHIGNRYLLDGAHNPAGARALREFIDEFEKERPITIVFGAMSEKDVPAMASALFPRGEPLVLTKPSNSRAMSAAELKSQIPEDLLPKSVILADSVEDALAQAEACTPDDGIILVAGSLYLVGEVKKLLNNR